MVLVLAVEVGLEVVVVHVHQYFWSTLSEPLSTPWIVCPTSTTSLLEGD